MSKFKVIFRGELLNPDSKEAMTGVTQKLAKFLNIPPDKSDILFSGKPFKLKGDLTDVQAKSLHEKFAKLGLKVEILDEVEVFPDVTEQRKVNVTEVSTSISEQDELEAEIPERWKKTVSKLSDIESDLSEADKDSSWSLLMACNKRKESGLVLSMPGLIFGIFYYFYLGMVKKAFLLMGVSVTLVTIFDSVVALLNMEQKWYHALIIPNLLYAIFAKVDYYNIKINEISGYASLKHFSNPIMVAVSVIVTLWIAMLASLGISQLNQASLIDSGFSRKVTNENISSRSGTPEQSTVQTVTLNGKTYFASYSDLENHSKSSNGTKNGVLIYEVN